MEDKDRELFFLIYLCLLNPSRKSISFQNQHDPSQEPVTPLNHVPETVSSPSQVLEPVTKVIHFSWFKVLSGVLEEGESNS